MYWQKINGFFDIINTSIKNKFYTPTMKDRLGDYPYTMSKQGGKIIIKFHPKGENLKFPDSVKFALTLSDNDVKKLKKILS